MGHRTRHYRRRKGKPAREIDTSQLPDINAEKCCNGVARKIPRGGGEGGKGGRKRSRGETRVAPTDEGALVVRSSLPCLSGLRAREKSTFFRRLVTWSTVNDRESSSRTRCYAGDPDARNVIAARLFPSILGDPRGPLAVTPRLTHIAVTTDSTRRVDSGVCVLSLFCASRCAIFSFAGCSFYFIFFFYITLQH
ncbi:hypothetical protein PUN28_006757 [Cardiocondyla obscurior]|uniref:Uncharacterized protein n=1 Tax=Cardiocondyla obscurior TaxID=286306 RepID=A0AAW2G1Z6_9HYME